MHGKPRRAVRRTSPGSSGINETTAGHLRALSKLHFQGSFPSSRAHGTLSPQGRGEAGFHGTQFGKGRARPGRGAARVPASLLRAASRLLAPAGCGPACATAAWSPRSWRGRSSRSSRAPCSRACSMSSFSVSPPPGVPPVGAGDPPPGPAQPDQGSRGKGKRRSGPRHQWGGDTHTPTHRQMVQSPPLAPTCPPTGQLPRQGASRPSRGLSSRLPMMRRVLRSPEVSQGLPTRTRPFPSAGGPWGLGPGQEGLLGAVRAPPRPASPPPVPPNQRLLQQPS